MGVYFGPVFIKALNLSKRGCLLFQLFSVLRFLTHIYIILLEASLTRLFYSFLTSKLNITKDLVVSFTSCN